jgi:hypothetical protein
MPDIDMDLVRIALDISINNKKIDESLIRDWYKIHKNESDERFLEGLEKFLETYSKDPRNPVSADEYLEYVYTQTSPYRSSPEMLPKRLEQWGVKPSVFYAKFGEELQGKFLEKTRSNKFADPQAIQEWFETLDGSTRSNNRSLKNALNAFLLEQSGSGKKTGNLVDQYIQYVMGKVVGWTDKSENASLLMNAQKAPDESQRNRWLKSYTDKMEKFLNQYGMTRSLYIEQVGSNPDMFEAFQKLQSMQQDSSKIDPTLKDIRKQMDSSTKDREQEERGGFGTPAKKKGILRGIKDFFFGKKSSSDNSMLRVSALIRMGFTHDEVYDLYVVNNVDVDVFPVY